MKPLAADDKVVSFRETMIAFSHSRTTDESMREYGRGIAGGLMFSIPLFYTAEMWQSGFILQPGRILLFAVATLGILLLYNRYSGLRRDASFAEVAIDSVEEMGIGLVLAAGMLALTGSIGLDSAPVESLGKIVMEAMTTAVGVSVGTAQLGAPDDGDKGEDGEEAELDAYLPQTAIALCGAVLFAANIAPTDEVPIIANQAAPLRLLAIAGVSLGICALVFYFAGFRGAGKRVARGSWFLALRGVATSYAVGLATSAAFLAFFGRFDGEPLFHCLALTVVLALPTVLGASAGRLLLQSDGDTSSSS